MDKINSLNKKIEELETENYNLGQENKELKTINTKLEIISKKNESKINILKEKTSSSKNIDELKHLTDKKLEKLNIHFFTLQKLIYKFHDHIFCLRDTLIKTLDNLVLNQDFKIDSIFKNIELISLNNELSSLYKSSHFKKNKIFIDLKDKLKLLKSIKINELQNKFNSIKENFNQNNHKNTFDIDLKIIKDNYDNMNNNEENNQTPRLNIENTNEEVNILRNNIINILKDNPLYQLENNSEPNPSLTFIGLIIDKIRKRFNQFSPNHFTLKNLKIILLSFKELFLKYKEIIISNLESQQNETMSEMNIKKNIHKQISFSLNTENDDLNNELYYVEEIIKDIIKKITGDLNNEEIYNKFLEMNLKIKDLDKNINIKEVIKRQNKMIINKISTLNFEIIKTSNLIKIYEKNIENKKIIIENKENDLFLLQEKENKKNKIIENQIFDIMDLSENIYIKKNILDLQKERESLTDNYLEKKDYNENIKEERNNLESELNNLKNEISNLKNESINNTEKIKEFELSKKNNELEYFEELKNQIEKDFFNEILN